MIRKPEERLNDECVTPTVKYGGRSLMVWECFQGNRTDLIQVKAIMEKEYHSLLQRHAIASGLPTTGKKFHLLTKQRSKHSSTWCQNYLKSRKKNVTKL